VRFWSAENIRRVTGGSWLRRPDAVGGRGTREVEGLGTDTRAMCAGRAFLALRGARYDGHDFLEQAAAAGSPLLIVDRADAVGAELLRSGNGPAILKASDGPAALGALAGAYRRTLTGVRVIAVCGANGKTTTSRLIHAILGTRLRGSASPRSFNNEIGVPLTILGAKASDQYLVCEVGTNAPGETARLGRIVKPDVAVITSVGRAHIEFFDSLDAVVREDAAIFADLAPGGVAIVPADEPRLAELLKPVPHVVGFGTGACADLRLTAVEHARLSDGREGIRFSVNDRSHFEAPLVGEHNAHNALAAIAVARRLGLDDALIARGLLLVAPADMRLNRRRLALPDQRGEVELLVDCYNANPESAAAAVRTFAALSGGAEDGERRRVLILGDMLELGAQARECHVELAGVIERSCRAEMVVTVGPEALHIAESLSRVWPEAEFVMLSELTPEQARRVAGRLKSGDFVLLKGSRGVRLERIVEAIEAGRGAGASSRVSSVV